MEPPSGVSTPSLLALNVAKDTDDLFPGLRNGILDLHFQGDATPRQRAYVSALSGGIAGGAVTRLMGTSVVMPLEIPY